jgi:Tfp pilus assembly protein PilO
MDLHTPTATKVLGGLSLVAVAGLSWVLVLGPETSTLSDTRLQIESARQQNQVLTQQLSQLEAQRGELQKTRRTASALGAKFPPTADQPGLFEEVTAAAVDAGIGAKGVTTLAPTPPVIGGAAGGVTPEPPAPGTGSGQLASQTVSVSVTGTYDETERLLENLEQMPRAYLITTVALSGSGESSTGAFTTTIAGEMFVMPPIPDPGKTVNLDATTTTD